MLSVATERLFIGVSERVLRWASLDCVTYAKQYERSAVSGRLSGLALDHLAVHRRDLPWDAILDSYLDRLIE